jgi:glycosyltransferase involved in cell wall biosynthesis
MPRIHILNRRFCPGEAWTNRILAYAKGFAEAGEDVVLYYIITDKQRTRPDISIPGVKVVNLWESDGFIAKKFKIVSFIKNLLRFPGMIEKGDRLFVYGGYDYQLQLAKWVRKKAKVFCEITEHPQVFESSASDHKKNLQKIKKMGGLDGLFVISNSLKEYFIKEGLPEKKVHVINMFVDTNRFINVPVTNDIKYIAYCGIISYGKDGVDILLKAFSDFQKHYADYYLKIIGRGVSSEEINSLKQLAKDLDIENKVVFTGQVAPNDMPLLLKNASILALARPDSLQSRNGFPTKLGEYLATGRPVVVTRVGEIPLFLKDKENAILANPGDPKDFARQLCWVADNYDVALEIGCNGQLLAQSEFNYKTQSQSALGFIKASSRSEK